MTESVITSFVIVADKLNAVNKNANKDVFKKAEE